MIGSSACEDFLLLTQKVGGGVIINCRDRNPADFGKRPCFRNQLKPEFVSMNRKLEALKTRHKMKREEKARAEGTNRGTGNNMLSGRVVTRR